MIRTQASVAHFNNLMLGTVFSLFKEIYEDFVQQNYKYFEQKKHGGLFVK